MSDKRKRRSELFGSKNLIMLGVTAAALIAFAVIMNFAVPESIKTDESDFDNAAWKSAVEEAEEKLNSSVSDGYDADAAQTASNSLPNNVATNEGAEQNDAAVPPSTAENAETNDTSESQNTTPIMSLPVNGAVTKDYSGDNLVYSDTMQDWRTHNGIDFFAEDGSDVVSAADGVVEAVTDDGMYGKTVIVLHNGGVRSIYSNLSDSVEVVAGDDVLTGSLLGKVGSTAAAEASEEPHLHFEVSLNEETVNPHDYLISE